jgi:hypothetical protein
MSAYAAFCGSEYISSISIVPSAYGMFPANGTSGIYISGSTIRVWCEANSNQLCYNSSSSYSCYQDATKKMTLTDEGQGTNFYRERLDPSLILWMNMSGSGDDASLYRWPSTKAGTISIGDGRIGYGMHFNNSYYNFGDLAAFNGLTNITVMAWVFSKKVGGIVSKMGDMAASGWVLDGISPYPAPGCYFAARISGSTMVLNDNTYCASNYTWFHLAATFNGSIMKIYVNGTLTYTLSAIGNITNGSANLLIGRNGATFGNFTGLLDDIRVYNRTLSPQEISDIYNFTSGVPTSSGGESAMLPETKSPLLQGSFLASIYAAGAYLTFIASMYGGGTSMKKIIGGIVFFIIVIAFAGVIVTI